MKEIPFFRGTDEEGNLPTRTRVAVGVLALAVAALAIDVALGGGAGWEIEGMAVVVVIIALHAITGKNDLRDEGEEEVPRRLVACPCCEHLTIEAGWRSTSCVLCEWELGGTADNLGYTPEEGRANFRQFSTFYRPGDVSEWGGAAISASEVTAKQELLEVLRRQKPASGQPQTAEPSEEFDRLAREIRRLRKERARHGG